MNEPQVGRTTELTNRLLDEGAVLVVKAAQAEGITISSKTALRWCIAGVRGVRLESLKIGGKRLTSRPALRRFIAATQPPPAEARPVELCLDRDAAERILQAYGLGRSQCAKRSGQTHPREGKT